MRQRLSALLDGELDAAAAGPLLAGMRHDPALRAAWSEYRLVGDALRTEVALAGEMTGRIMAALQDEPAILVPRPPGGAWRQHAHSHALALAASVAGVAVVAWLAFAPQATQQQAANGRTAQVAAAGGAQEYAVAYRPKAKLVCLADEK